MKPVSSKQRGNRPDWYEYYINIAMAVRDRANCHGSKIGSILVLDNRILTTGYNGTPQDDVLIVKPTHQERLMIYASVFMPNKILY